MSRPTAVVSGLGPNGALAALHLVAAGFDVVAAEQRPRHERPIHIGLRATWLDAVRGLSPELHARISAIASPIVGIERRRTDGAPVSSTVEADDDVAERLRAPPLFHARIDEIERVLAGWLDEVARTDGRLVLHRGRRVVLTPRHGAPTGVELVSDEGATALTPDLVVVAEGGKSSNARRIGARAALLSPARHYLSVHVCRAIGPITRRIDAPRASCWATGHADPAKGTWIVVEIEAPPAHGARDAFDEDAFVAGASLLFDEPVAKDALLASIDHPFRGTFRFEQQMLLRPAHGDDVVFLGDCAGMGHHAHCSGLELGACDATALRRLAADVLAGADRAAAVARYAAVVRRSRVELLAFGLPEYHGAAGAIPAATVAAVVDEAERDPAFLPDRALIGVLRG